MYAKHIKRLLDIMVGIASLPFLALLFALLAPLIYLEDRGPIFYNATRVGKDGKPFCMYKFRSMKFKAPDITSADGTTYNDKNDPRITRIGRFMRASSLDEFPQFLNILKGDMSLIGPRPHLEREVALYTQEQRARLKARPGLTGLAAVEGRNLLSWEERLAKDVYYVNHLSFKLDLHIFCKTFVVLCKREGIYEQDNEYGTITPQDQSVQSNSSYKH